MKSIITKSLLLLFLCLQLSSGWAQELSIKKDLAKEWMVNRDSQYEPFVRGDVVSTVYFSINTTKFPGDYLVVKSSSAFTLFINGRLCAEAKVRKLSLDSLSRAMSSSLAIAVHQRAIRRGSLTTEIQSSHSVLSESGQPQKRPSWFFRDFVITGFLILIVMLIVIIQLNPKLASDYFSVIKVFSLRESEESQVYLRITSSTNILFYILCSLLLGYYLIIIFHFVPARYSLALQFQPENFWMAIVHWLEISLILLALFFVKIVLVYGLTRLFGMQGVAGIHFFNWVRSMLVVFGAITIVLSIYFIVRGQNESFFRVLLQLIAWILVGWMILIFLKLSARMSHSMFHLFSYICATELIPFLITIKVLYN